MFPNLSAVKTAFEQNFLKGKEVGAALSIWRNGEQVLELHKGFADAKRTTEWRSDTIVLIWSATKGLSAACVNLALQDSEFSLNSCVSEFWPEFARNGKEEITVADVLSHRAGLGALDTQDLSLLDHDAVARAIEEQAPKWLPEHGHGYGPKTFGFIADEIVRRLTNGTSLQDFWNSRFRQPLGLDLYIGLPESKHTSAAQMIAPRATCVDDEDEFVKQLATPGSLTRLAFSSPGGTVSPSTMNSPHLRSAALPSLGAIGSASSLAQFYTSLINPAIFPLGFTKSTLSAFSTRLASGYDKILHIDTAFSTGFMLDPINADGEKTRSLFGPALGAFGHPGAGGSLAFADPENGISFAYVMNQMEAGVLPSARGASLVAALYS